MDSLHGVLVLQGPGMAEKADGEVLSADGRCRIGQRRVICDAAQRGTALGDPAVTAGMVGDLTNLPDLRRECGLPGGTDLEVLIRLYQAEGFPAVRRLEGFYTGALYDGRCQTLYVFQDPLSSPLPLYWTAHGGRLFFGTSLKKLLALSGAARDVDADGLAHFMVNGFIPDSRTLLRAVRKLPPERCLVATRARYTEARLPVARPGDFDVGADFEEAAGTCRAVLERVLSRAIGGCAEPVLHATATGGLDTNFLLHVAAECGGRPIHGYCVGAEDTGQYAGESARAERIAANRGGMVLRQTRLSEGSIQRLPDMVWRLEGACFERGVFVRHALGELVARYGGRCLIGGAMANETMNPRFGRRPLFRRRHSGQPEFWNAPWHKDVLYGRWRDRPRELALFLNIKQCGILLSSFGLRPKYPYADRPYLDLVRALRARFGDARKLHVRVVRHFLPAPVLAQIDKPRITGIDEAYYFRAPALRRRVAAFLSASEFLASMCRAEALHRLLAVFEEGNDPVYTRTVARVLYVELWHRLFARGEFDGAFGNAGFDRALDTFIGRD